MMSTPAPAPLMVPGQNGMVLMEYVGANDGRQTFRGPVTTTPYTFKGSRRQFYVDSRDASEMREIVADHMRIFRVVPVPVPELEPAP